MQLTCYCLIFCFHQNNHLTPLPFHGQFCLIIPILWFQRMGNAFDSKDLKISYYENRNRMIGKKH